MNVPRPIAPVPVPVIAPPDQCFWIYEGPALKDLRELAEALTAMSDETFAHHVTEDRNDFVPWVRDVLADAALADELSRFHARAAAAEAVKKHLARYERRTAP